MPTYNATLKPADVPLDDASDVRTVTFSTYATDAGQVRADAHDHIRQEGIIDPWTLYHHWDIVNIQLPLPHLTSAKKQLFDLSPEKARQLASQRSSTTPPPILEFPLPTIDATDTRTAWIAPSQDEIESYHEWRTTFSTTAINEVYLHEILLQTAIKASPGIVDTLATDPETHDSILSTAQSCESLAQSVATFIVPPS